MVSEEVWGTCVALNRTILVGDVLEALKCVPDSCIDTIIDSPPYWGLRNYGVEGQWGLEPDFKEYLSKMQTLMNELKRILKPTGSCWINLGDTYSGGNAHSDWDGADERFDQKRQEEGKFTSIAKRHIANKSRYGIPERFYIDCIDNGWIARNHIPWYKSNAMPTSIKDRFQNKWESIFFFVKQQKYYFNLDAVREQPVTGPYKPFNRRIRDAKMLQESGITYQAILGSRMSEDEMKNTDKLGARKQDNTKGADGKPKPTYDGFNDRWKEKRSKTFTEENPNNYTDMMIRTQNLRDSGLPHDNPLGNPLGKNPGDVFFINPKPFPEAHFATFPVELPLKILKCACPSQVCKKCGTPRYPADQDWTDCGCGTGWRPGLAFDPFFGAGTVGVAAEMLGLWWAGIELNEDYVKIAKKRLQPYMNCSIMEFS